MKPIRPVYREAVTPTYPTVVDLARARRGFLKNVLTSAVAIGGWLLGADGGGRGAAARTGWRRVNLRLTSRFRFSGCAELYVDKLVVQTRSQRLERFLRDRQEAPGLEQAVLKVLKAHACADLQNQKRLARLETRLGAAIEARYYQRTRRRVARPLVTLVLVRWVRPADPGFFGSIPPPVPRP